MKTIALVAAATVCSALSFSAIAEPTQTQQSGAQQAKPMQLAWWHHDGYYHHGWGYGRGYGYRGGYYGCRTVCGYYYYPHCRRVCR